MLINLSIKMKILTVKNIMIGSILYLVIISILFKTLGFYTNSTFFSFTHNITFFSVTIDTYETYIAIHIIIFFHQLIQNLVNTVVYPWIINEVQNNNCKHLTYKKCTTILIINAFDIYSELDMILILYGFTTQISFVINIILANVITTTITSINYIKNKNYQQEFLFEQIV
jgi:hypothetical protein